MGQNRASFARWQNAQWDIGWKIARWWSWLLEAERGRFVLWLPVCMGAGVLAYYAPAWEPPAWIGAKFAAAGFSAALACGRWPVTRALALAIGFAALGFASAQYATYRAPPLETDLPATAMIVSGTVRAVEMSPRGRRVTLTEARLQDDGRQRARAPVASRSLARMVRIRLRAGDETAIETGDSLRVRAMLRPPPPPAWPGAWDLQRDAYFRHLGGSGYALGPPEITVHAPPDRFLAWIQWLRETIAARITAVIPGAAGMVSVTLLTGAAGGIPEADRAAFRDSGLAHILAVAGLHLGIVMGFSMSAARTAMALSERASLFWPTKKIAALFALAMGGFYMLLTGAHVPIMRGFAMACLYTLAVLAGRQPLSVRGLGLAGIALMLIAPYEAPGVSFQMSFSAVLALIAGYEALRPWLRKLHGRSMGKRVAAHVVALALTSTLAGTASLPYGAYHFGHVQIYYVVSNMVAVPLTAFWVMPAGFFALLLMPLGLESLALVPMGWGAELIVMVARITADLPAATFLAPHVPPWGLAVLSFGLAWLGIWRSWLRLAGIAAIAAGIASPLFDRPPDILVSPDARLIGFRTEAGIFTQETKGASSFVRDAWKARWSDPVFQPMPPEGWAASGTLTCVRDACVFRPRPEEMAALLVRGPSKPTGCGGAAVVVSAEPARGVCHWPAPRPVDRFTVWKEGAVAIWLEPLGARVLTDRADRGARPWVSPLPKPRAPPLSRLPAAPVDR